MKTSLKLLITVLALGAYLAPVQVFAAANADHANQNGIDNSASNNAGGNGGGKGKGHGDGDVNHGGKHEKWS